MQLSSVPSPLFINWVDFLEKYGDKFLFLKEGNDSIIWQ